MNKLINNLSGKETWKVAIYVRISREDEKDEKYKRQSESIENQIKYLKEIIKEAGWNLFDIYSDDGYTGTNFNRPDFQRMIKDIEIGKVNLVITKDLSRLGRDYIETGRYIEKYFPQKGIRYIAVNDNVDTYDNSNANNDITPFKAVFNDMYAKDISKKVRTAIITKASAGDCIKAFLPYGYKKSPLDKRKIIIDEEVAINVKRIFDLYLSGYSKSQIAQQLNSEGIITPLKYKQENSNYYNPNIKSQVSYMWNSTTINKILRDRIYTGDLVQLKYKKVNYKIKKTEKVPIDQHIIIENNHIPIINKNIYNTVQKMLDRQTNEWSYNKKKKHLLTGLVFCKCGSRITYSKNHGKYFRCICSSYKKYGKKFCNNIQYLREDELITAVKISLQSNIKKYLDITELKFERNRKQNRSIQIY